MMTLDPVSDQCYGVFCGGLVSWFRRSVLD